MFKRFKLFQFAAVTIFAAFMSLIFIVIFFSFSRFSGSTGINMAEIQRVRAEAK